LVNARSADDYTSLYGLRTERTPLSSWLSIFNVRTAMFDSKHRVAVAMDKFNIGIIKFANFKVKFQTKKTKRVCIRIFRRRRCINLYSYWTKRTPSKLLIGMDELETELTYANNIPLEGFGSVFGTWSKTVGDITAELAYKGIFENTYISEWKDELEILDARIKLFGSSISITDEAWDIGKKTIKSEIQSRVTSYIRNTAGNYSPMAVVIPRADQETYIYNGVEEYTNKQDHKIKFPAAESYIIAFTYNSGGHWRPDMPSTNKFKFKSGSIFGAAYYNGKWRGVRIEM